MVESPGVSRYFKNKNTEKEVHQFHEDYSTKRGEKTTENQDGDAWEGVNRACRTLAGTAFMGKLLFRQRVQETVRKERGANARYQMVDGVQMVVVGLIAGATSMVQVVKVWSDEVLMKMAGWKEIPVDSTAGRIMKLVSPGDIVELTGIIHRFRGQV